MIHYKVTNNAMRSWYAMGDAEVQYKIEEWSQAPEEYAKFGFHLFVFDTLENAKAFLYSEGGYVGGEVAWGKNIWECECEEEVPIPAAKPYNSSAYMMRAGWVGSPIYMPKGTMMFKRVKLTGRALQ